MIAAILITIAAIADAIKDTSSHHYHISVLNKLNRQWWDASVSWRNKYVGGHKTNGRTKITLLGLTFTKPVQITDAWHLFKTIYIFAIIAAIVTYKPITYPIIDFAIFGTIHNTIFSLFYNKILLKL